MRLVANDVAEAVNREHQKVQFRDWVQLKSLQTELTLRVRKPTSREVEAAEAVLSKKTERLLSPEEVYARETVLIKDYPDEVTLILQALRIGELRVAAIPCEVFVEIGLDLKRETKPSFTVSLANGYNGYLPTTEHFKLGGYETWRARSSYLETNAAQRIYKTVVGLMKQLD
jgi:neutral ceramidase